MTVYNNTEKQLPSLPIVENIDTLCNKAFQDLIGLTKTHVSQLTQAHKQENMQDTPPKKTSVSHASVFSKKQKKELQCNAVIDSNGDLPGKRTLNIDISNTLKSNYLLYFKPIIRRDIDPISNLPNGWAMRSRAQQLFSQRPPISTKLAILVLNIDNFSSINYRYGFEIGDSYLEKIGVAIKKIADSYLVVRYSNAKFGILIENNHQFNDKQFKSHVTKLSKKLCKLSQSALLIDNSLRIKKTFSIGISMQFTDYQDYHSMEVAAESAMKAEQNTYISSFNFAHITDISTLTSKKLIIDALPNALLENKIEVFYQPQYDVKTEKLIGFEALSRWQHETLGNIPANIFIDISEKIGLHLEFDLWVFHKVCTQIVSWLNIPLSPPKIAINISFKTAEMSSFIPRINKIIKATSCPVTLIEIEITETAAIKNELMLTNNIKALKKLGFSIAVDDFGSGYSSLSLLRKYQPYFTKLKLDKSLIDNICETEIDMGVVKQIIKLGKLMKLEVLAEGVEHKCQLVVLKELSCHSAQGFYFNKALSVEKTTALLGSK